MKNAFLFFSLFLSLSPLFGKNVSSKSNGVIIKTSSCDIELECFSPSIIRIIKVPSGEEINKESLSVVMKPQKVIYNVEETDNNVFLTTADLIVSVDIKENRVSFKTHDDKELLTEKPLSTKFLPYDDSGRKAYTVSQTFLLDKNESIYGLGQIQNGLLNQRNQNIFLQQENTKISIPVIQSIKGYALFWDNYSPTTFTDNEKGMTFSSKVGDVSDYYIIYGGNADKVVSKIHDLTGHAPMFPLWSFGFWQSRERYTSQEEIVGVVEKYRKLHVPLDGIVQDWHYWGDDNKYWNAVEFRSKDFSEPQNMMNKIHEMNAHAIISVWPSFGISTEIYAKLNKENKLMPLETFPQNNGVRVYDAYSPKARDIYWEFINKNLFRVGLDGWWLDATEPEHSPIVDGDFDYKTYLGSFGKVRNAFPLVSVKGVYEHQRKENRNKRVFILTRSAFIGQQRYAAQSWSGDVISDWDVLRNQIPAALSISLTGIPYWNSDIGGFFSANKYPQGIKDSSFQKLYVRWMQFATFTGMMRSHGTNTPREIYMFGERGTWAFDAQEKMINLRYLMLPYIYSTSWNITSKGGMLMRPLFSDFPNDVNVPILSNEYLFGNSILVSPVTNPTNVHTVYLPKGSNWIDFWNANRFSGGQSFTYNVPNDIIPLFVKCGSIIPFGPKVQFAQEKSWHDLQIRVYPGADGEFTLYEDENDNYNYEKEKYTLITMKWDDKRRVLSFMHIKGSYEGMMNERNFNIVLVENGNGVGLDGETFTKSVKYNGERVDIELP